jgi:hypothetical protein
VISFVLSEVVTQILKRVAGQARPTTSIPGLDVHWLPQGPVWECLPVGPHERRHRPCHGAMALADLAATSRRGGRRGFRGAQSPIYRGALARRRGRRGGHRAALGVRVLAGGSEMAHPPRRIPGGARHLGDLQDCAPREGDRPGHVRLHQKPVPLPRPRFDQGLDPICRNPTIVRNLGNGTVVASPWIRSSTRSTCRPTGCDHY